MSTIAGDAWILLVHAGATLLMTGVIWFVQVVHYPLMDGVGAAGFVAYEARHVRRTTWIVAPPMLVEAATTVILVLRPGGLPAVQTWMGLALLLVIWLATAALQVPQHRRLESGFDGSAHRRLVATNWIRVAAWTSRSVLALIWLGAGQ